MIGNRLREERNRLKLTQPAFAEAAGVSKRTIIDWEKGETSPTAVQLSALFENGVNIQYVIAGARNVPTTLSEEHSNLLDAYDNASDFARRHALAMLEESAAKSRENEGRSLDCTDPKSA